MTDLAADLRAALADRYAIEREIGRGGMATVYLARDLRHERLVALKALRPDLAAALGPERFAREISLAAKLQHPHILTVLDSGETPAGLLWFTMPYVEGESLRDRLDREKQLPLEDALQITQEIADALEYAHRRGVIHRDIKPENILLSGSHALAADFGVARALKPEPAGSETLTETGMTLGTPTYMSPEQATGERTVDGRTDVYALGCVLYEMLAGEPPYTGATAQVLLAKRVSGEVPSVRRLRPAVPASVDAALATALAPVPADRFATAADFARALTAKGAPAGPTMAMGGPHGPKRSSAHRLPSSVAFVLGLVVTAMMGALIWQRTHRGGDAAAPGGTIRLAVLPFENLGPPDQEYFADGVTDAVRGKLTALHGLQVTASSSSGQYKRTSKTPQQIGEDLGVQYLLLGKVRWEKLSGGTSRVEVSPELIEVSRGASKWQQPFDAELTDVFQMQADIASRVAGALDVALGAGEKQELEQKPTANLAAYDAYLKGDEAAAGFDQVAAPDLRRAIDYYERAVALDSTFALAWAQLSRAHSSIYFISTPTAHDAEEARSAAERALALAPGLAAGHLALGDYYYRVPLDWTQALEQYSLGRKIAPTDADILKGVAIIERSQGKWDESQASLKQAQALDPRSISTARRYAGTLLWLRRYPEALEAADRALQLDTRAPDLYQTKAMVFLAQGDTAGARAVLVDAERDVEPTALVAWMAEYWDLYWELDDAQQRLLLHLTPSAFDDSRAQWALVMAQTYAFRGDGPRTRAFADTARVALEEQLKATPEDAQQHAELGLALAYLGRKEEGEREGERAIALAPLTKDAYGGAYDLHQLVRIYLLVGEPEKALDRLDTLLRVPYYLSPGWLRIDPTFAPLRGNPRFERLVAGK
jgi:TolB-like protein/Tfp pilus assembly protein PilF